MINPHVAVKKIVSSYHPGNPCNLNWIMIVLMYSKNIEYEPEVFPGLVCRISGPHIEFILFSSGKITEKEWCDGFVDHTV